MAPIFDHLFFILWYYDLSVFHFMIIIIFIRDFMILSFFDLPVFHSRTIPNCLQYLLILSFSDNAIFSQCYNLESFTPANYIWIFFHSLILFSFSDLFYALTQLSSIFDPFLFFDLMIFFQCFILDSILPGIDILTFLASLISWFFLCFILGSFPPVFDTLSFFHSLSFCSFSVSF